MMTARAQMFQLKNNMVTLSLSELGASLLSCQLRTADGFREVLRGESDPAARLNNPPYYNAIIGRVANRVGHARYVSGGQTVLLEANEGPHHLHGASSGLHRVIWQGEHVSDGEVLFRYCSPAGTAGYPGNLKLEVRYKLLADGVEIVLEADTDAVTPVSLTHHNYFNLCPDADTVLDHRLQVNAEAYTPSDEALIPTGEIASVRGSALDLRRSRTLADILSRLPAGLDHNYVLNTNSEDAAALLMSPDGSLSLSLFTDLPGLQIYSCNQSELLADGRSLPKHFALCLEPQFFPDAVNHTHFQNTLLEPDEHYRHFIRYAFAARGTV